MSIIIHNNNMNNLNHLIIIEIINHIINMYRDNNRIHLINKDIMIINNNNIKIII